MLQDLKEHFCKCEKIATKLYRFEKIHKEINDIHISMTMSLITLRKILVNINELRLLHHRERIKQKLNDSLKWQCIFDTNPSPIVFPNCVKLPKCKMCCVIVFLK